jgi:hypothetical protein
MSREFALDDLFEPDQDDLDGEVARSSNRAFDSGLGGEITPHRV